LRGVFVSPVIARSVISSVIARSMGDEAIYQRRREIATRFKKALAMTKRGSRVRNDEISG
jgi:hypothetical protein